jgi:hypothetical protein
MKRALGILFLSVMLLSCAHGRTETHNARTMYYGNTLDAVFAASEAVLAEQGYDIIESNRHDRLIKAIRATKIPGARVTVILTLREEGSGTWLEIEKKVPPQFVPGSTAGYRMDIDDLFHLIEMELDRNW